MSKITRWQQSDGRREDYLFKSPLGTWVPYAEVRELVKELEEAKKTLALVDDRNEGTVELNRQLLIENQQLTRTIRNMQSDCQEHVMDLARALTKTRNPCP